MTAGGQPSIEEDIGTVDRSYTGRREVPYRFRNERIFKNCLSISGISLSNQAVKGLSNGPSSRHMK